ncbi:MAG TPA: DnaJ domain-containing protein [Candidatus Binatia bacterium]|jgi:hypothetical protein
MSDAKFYQVLGVRSSATADEIKSAYRDLVKRYHPDLFHSTRAKAEATEKLRQINEAYAVLGNPQRRKRYDQAFTQEPQTPPQARTRTERGQTSPPPRRPQPRAPRPAFKIPNLPRHFSKKWAGYALAAAGLIFILDYAGRSVPRFVTTWILFEKLEISLPNMAPTDGAGTGWVRVGEYASVAECAAVIKQKVRLDENEGSEAVYDERHGTMAITLHIKKETGHGQQTTANAPGSTPDNITKRVRTLECRTAQRVEMESRFRRGLRSIGLML